MALVTAGRWHLADNEEVELRAVHNSDPLLDVSEAAEYLGLSVPTIRRMIRLRKIEFVKIGAAVRIRRSVLDAYIAAGTVPPTGRAA